MAICKFCDEQREHLIKAHIIPRSFFGLVRKDAKYAVLFQARQDGVRTDFQQAGIYDDSILCEECERLFAEWDAHGFSVLSKERVEEDLYRDPSGFECGIILRDLNYKLFKLFLLSVLWRASVSRDQFFSNVQLGSHEKRIRTFLKMRSDPTIEEYSAILILPLGQPFTNVMLMPWRSRIAGVWFYRLYFPNVIALVKVDQRPTPAAFDKIQLRPNGDNYFVFQPHKGTAEDGFFRGLHEFMRKNDLFEKADVR